MNAHQRRTQRRSGAPQPQRRHAFVESYCCVAHSDGRHLLPPCQWCTACGLVAFKDRSGECSGQMAGLGSYATQSTRTSAHTIAP